MGAAPTDLSSASGTSMNRQVELVKTIRNTVKQFTFRNGVIKKLRSAVDFQKTAFPDYAIRSVS